MAQRQKIILMIGAFIAVLMILFPPYSQAVLDSSNAELAASTAFVPDRNLTAGQSFIGYHFILSGPPAMDAEELAAPGIFLQVWLVQILVVFIVTVISVYLTRDRSDEADEAHEVLNVDLLARKEVAET